MIAVKLKKIEISNYRSCINTTFEPNDGLSALIGPNGSGKTTVLAAFQLLGGLLESRYYGGRRRDASDFLSSDCGLKVSFDWNGKLVIFEAKISLVNNERNEDEILSSSESWYAYSITRSKKKIDIPISLFADGYRHPGSPIKEGLIKHFAVFYSDIERSKMLLDAMGDIIKYIGSITYYSASMFTNPSSCPISFEVERESGGRRGISIAGHKKFLYDLYSCSRSSPEEFSQFIELTGKDGVQLIDRLDFQEIETSSSIYKVSVGGRITTKEKKNNLVIPNFMIAGNSLSPSQLSEGTFRALALIFYLITDHGSIMLIEEPEVCIHHGLLSSVIELIKIYASEKQIIISTHSDQLLDCLDIESVFKVVRGVDGTEVRNVKKSLDEEELRALREYLRNEGGIGEYWKHGAL